MIKKSIPVYYICNSVTIDEMALYLPQTLDEIIKIKGFGQAKAKQYGHSFLKLITEYCDENNLTSSVINKEPKKAKKEKSSVVKEDSKHVSYTLFKEGNSVSEIAKLRNFAVSTIESHLTFYVQQGMISINELVKSEKLILIEPHIENLEGDSITPIKEKLGDSVTYSEIRMVLAAKEWERIKDNV